MNITAYQALSDLMIIVVLTDHRWYHYQLVKRHGISSALNLKCLIN